jgi:CRP-like cAMP-binding protein
LKEVCRLGAGQGFGHEALLHDGNLGRIGAVKCLTECQLLSVSKHDYQKLLKKYDDRDKEQSLKFYRDLPYFDNWTRSNLLRLLECFQPRFFKKDQIVLHEGQHPSGRYMFIIRDGEFEVIKKIHYPKPPKAEEQGCIEELMAKVDFIKFMEARHRPPSPNEKKPLPGTVFDEHLLDDELMAEAPMLNLRPETIEPIDGPRFVPPKLAKTLTTETAPYQPKPTEVTFMTLGPGQIFGEEYLINSVKNEENSEEAPIYSPPLYTIKCCSALGEVLIISEEEFQKKIITHKKTLDLIVENCGNKAKRCQDHLANECAYINPVSAWKHLEDEARKLLAENVTEVVVQQKIITTAHAH